MTYLIYNKETTRIHRIIRNRMWTDAIYKTETAAKTGLKREARLGKLNPDEVAIAPVAEFLLNIEKKKTVKNMMSGKELEIRVNTPACCDPSTETYWSM